MNLVQRQFRAAVTALAVASWGLTAHSATWNVAGGTTTWQNTGNWTSPATFPNGQDAVASLTNNITTDQNITLDGTITLGTLNVGDSTGATFNRFSIQPGTGGLLVFDSASGTA